MLSEKLKLSTRVATVLSIMLVAKPVYAESTNNIYVALSRSTLISLTSPAAEVVVANPDIVDVHVHNATHISLVAKGLGRTTVTVLDKDRKTVRNMEIVVGYDLPAIRKALKNFLPDETIGVEMVNSGIALTGQVRSATSIDKALKITRDFMQNTTPTVAPISTDPATSAEAALTPADTSAAPTQNSTSNVLNFLQVITGQQVMLRVRVGEIQRTALKSLGVDISAGITNGIEFATGAAGLGGLLQPATGTITNVAYGPGHLLFPTDSNNVPLNTQALIAGTVSKGRNTLTGALQALEQDGLFKLLAEPNLVAISGEQSEFLAGGEIPIPVPQGTSTGGTTITISYKPYGVAVKFKPTVLSENRIHIDVEPEVSELDPGNKVVIDTISVPALTTRRAKTTVELAPGEGFMIAGLLSDQSQATLNQVPGIMDIPIIGALFRSTNFQRNETELVIAVTPYIVDGVKGSDIKLPTDDFRPASDLEMFFYGALGTLAGKPQNLSQTKGLEGPTGFMVD